MVNYRYALLAGFSLSLIYAISETWTYTRWGLLGTLVICTCGGVFMLYQAMKTWYTTHWYTRASMLLDIGERETRAIMVLEDRGNRIKKYSADGIEFHSPTQRQLSAPDGRDQLLLGSGGEDNISTRVKFEDYVQPNQVSLSRIFIGLTFDDEPVYVDFRNMFHIIIAGTTRWGKSVFIRSILAQWLWASEEDMEFYLIDTGGATFKTFGLPFVDNAAEAGPLIRDLRVELDRRKALMQDDRMVDDLDEYNAAYPNNKLSRLVIIIEEGLDLLSENDALKKELTRLVSWAAKYGLHVVFISQSVKTSIIDNATRGNFSSRFQFHAEDRHQARTLIADSSAHKITDKGRYQAVLNGTFMPAIQSPIMDKETAVKAGNDFLANQSNGKVFDPDVYTWDLSELVDQEAESEADTKAEAEAEVGRKFIEIRDGPQFSWRKATKGIYGDTKFGETYNTKLKKTLDSLGISYE